MHEHRVNGWTWRRCRTVYFTDRGIGEPEERRGEEKVTFERLGRGTLVFTAARRLAAGG